MVAKYSGKLRVERDGVTSALLVLNNTTGEGILVNSEGSAYARYSAYLPFVKPYLDYEIARIADYCVSEGAENTSDGLWAITFDEVCEHFNIDLSDDPEIRDDLLDILRTREEIAEIVATEDGFEIRYSMDTTVEQNIQNRKLLSLGLDCLRLCGAMEREQTAELTEPLAMTM